MAVKYDPILDELRESDAGAGYTLPTASGVTLGGVRVGARLTMTGEVLSADVQTTDISGKVDKNIAITAGTKTKITYDAKGLITVGADATTADVADSTNKRYVTDANLTVIGNTSGTNTGDNATNSQYSGLATSKQDALSGTGFVKIAGTTISYDNSTYLTSLSGAVLTDQTVGQTIGLTGARLTKLWATDITVTNAITGSVTGNAGTVTTNANLTGVITSVGNATSIASQTGTGTKFVVDTSPTIITPTIANLIGNKIYPASDSTTAIQINKADNTTNVLNIDTTNGRVGIGTTAPLGILELSSTTIPSLILRHPTEAVGSTSRIRLNTGAGALSNGNSMAYISSTITQADPSALKADLKFYVNTGDLITTPAMTIADTGNVGIGTTNPGKRLAVRDTAATQAVFYGWDKYSSGAYDAGGQIQIGNHATDFGLLSYKGTTGVLTLENTYNFDDGDILFKTKTNGTAVNALTIKGTGNVGVGTTSPSGRLHINGTVDDQQLIVEAHSTQTSNIVEIHNSSSGVLTAINGSGWVGIGLTPLYPLHVQPADFTPSDATTSTIGQYVVLDSTPSVDRTTAVEYGMYFAQYAKGSKNIYQTRGLSGFSQTLSTATTTSVRGAQFGVSNGSTGTLTSGYGTYIQAGTNTGGGTLANLYGLFIESQTAGGTSNYAIVTNAGNIVFNEGGDASTDFRVESDTEANMLFLDANGDTDGALYLGGTTNGIKINKGGVLTFLGTASIADGTNIPLGSTTGTKIGTATTQKIGLWNATPIVQPTTAVTAATFAANTSGIVNDTATFDGYTIGQIVKALRNIGALA